MRSVSSYIAREEKERRGEKEKELGGRGGGGGRGGKTGKEERMCSNIFPNLRKRKGGKKCNSSRWAGKDYCQYPTNQQIYSSTCSRIKKYYLRTVGMGELSLTSQNK